MEVIYLTFLGLLGILTFLMISDEVFAYYVYIRIDLFIVNVKLFFWKLYLHPNNILTKWWFNHKLQKSFKQFDHE